MPNSIKHGLRASKFKWASKCSAALKLRNPEANYIYYLSSFIATTFVNTENLPSGFFNTVNNAPVDGVIVMHGNVAKSDCFF
jgi:hypothetical protein